MLITYDHKISELYTRNFSLIVILAKQHWIIDSLVKAYEQIHWRTQAPNQKRQNISIDVI